MNDSTEPSGEELVNMIPESQMETPDGKSIYLFRYENPNVKIGNPDSSTHHEDLEGRWFTDSPRSLVAYILSRPKGGSVVVAEAPKDKLEEFRASNHPVASEMDIEPDNFILPDEVLVSSKRFPITVSSAHATHFTFNDRNKVREFVANLTTKLKQAGLD